METVLDYLEQVSKSETTTAEDDVKVQRFLRIAGYPNCVVTLGIVYLEGKGTIQSPPTSIQQVIKTVLLVVKKHNENQKENTTEKEVNYNENF